MRTHGGAITVSRKAVESLNGSENARIAAFKECWDEMSEKGQNEVLVWLSATLDQNVAKHFGVGSAIELLIVSLEIEERALNIGSPRQIDNAADEIRERRGLCKIVRNFPG